MFRSGQKRSYTQRARAESSAQTAERILAAAKELFMDASYDDVSLQAVADRAGVALKTVLRRFGSKDALLVECAKRYASSESELRGFPIGDVPAVARTLARRYEQSMEMMRRYWPLEDRIEAVALVLRTARESHLEWLAKVFAPHLPRSGTVLWRKRRAELFAATEIFVWHSLRRRLGLSAALAEEVLVETLEALVTRWSMKTGD